MTLRILKRRTINPQKQFQFSESQICGVRDVQKLIQNKVHLNLHNRCICQICVEQKTIINQQVQKLKEFKESSKKNHQWLKKILTGLTSKSHKSLKLFVPDIMFIKNDGLEIFSTNKKDYRIIKFPGTTPLKAIYSTMLRFRKQYKGMLQENYRKTMIDKIDPLFMHAKYYEKLLPSHFHDGDGSRTLNANKSTFKKYVLHNNEKYIIGAIQQHKMNQKQPFCVLRFSQGSWQLLNQKQFQNLSLLKIPQDVVFVQSYIKSKQAQAICYSLYTQGSHEINYQLFKKAQTQILVMLEGLGKLDQGFDQLQNFEDFTDELMKGNPQKYAEYMTYKIVHFLSMVSNIYIRHIKIKWIINDIENVYLQEIIQFDTDQLSKRPIRFKLPAKGQNKNFYQDSHFFLQLHKQLKNKKQQSLKKIREDLKNKAYQPNLNRTINTIKNHSGQYSNQLLNKLEEAQSINNDNSVSSAHQSHVLKSAIGRKNTKKKEYLTKQSYGHSTKFKSSVQTTTGQKQQQYLIIPLKSSRRYEKIQFSNQKQHIKVKRRSISSFGCQIITRNQIKYKNGQEKQQKRRLNKSVNCNYPQVYHTIENKNNKEIFWKIHKNNNKMLKNTIEF